MVDSPPPPQELAAPEAPAQRAGVSRERYDADGRERPRFILDFPSDPDLDRLVEAFEAGNFALVRSEAPRLAQTSEREEVRAAANELRRRIDPDRGVVALLGIAVLLFLVLAVWAYFGKHDG